MRRNVAFLQHKLWTEGQFLIVSSCRDADLFSRLSLPFEAFRPLLCSGPVETLYSARRGFFLPDIAKLMWKLNANVAELRRQRFSCSLNVEKPEAGLHRFEVDGFPVDCRLLRVHAPMRPQVADCYLRGGDVVVSYHQTEHIRPQVVWRAQTVANEEGLQLSVTLALQTSQLLSDPHCQVSSELSAHELVTLDSETAATNMLGRPKTLKVDQSTLVLFRPKDQTWSVAQAVHPADYVSSELRCRKTTELRHALFQNNLEKGVILKGRVCLWLLPRERDLEIAAACLREFVSAPLPLTT